MCEETLSNNNGIYPNNPSNSFLKTTQIEHQNGQNPTLAQVKETWHYRTVSPRHRTNSSKLSRDITYCTNCNNPRC